MCEPILVCTSTPHAESTNASITAIQYDAMRSIYYTISFCSVGRPTGLFYFCIIAKRTLSLYTRVSVCSWVFILNRKHCRIASPRFCLTALVYIVHRVLFVFFYFFSLIIRSFSVSPSSTAVQSLMFQESSWHWLIPYTVSNREQIDTHIRWLSARI